MYLGCTQISGFVAIHKCGYFAAQKPSWGLVLAEGTTNAGVFELYVSWYIATATVFSHQWVFFPNFLFVAHFLVYILSCQRSLCLLTLTFSCWNDSHFLQEVNHVSNILGQSTHVHFCNHSKILSFNYIYFYHILHLFIKMPLYYCFILQLLKNSVPNTPFVFCV